jgi:hypothetical protein
MARKAVRRLDPEEKARRTKRIVGLGCGGLLVLVLLMVLINYVRARGGPALPSDIQARLQGQQAPTGAAQTAPGTVGPATTAADPLIPAGTPPLRQQLQQLDYASRNGDTRPQTLYVTDAELNDLMAGSIKDETVRDAHTYFGGDGKAYIVGLVNWKGQNLTITVSVRPVILNGGVTFVVESVNIGSMGAPDVARQKIQAEIDKNSQKLDPSNTGLHLTSIDIHPGLAILSGQAVRRSQ